jgi:hypothetical protein
MRKLLINGLLGLPAFFLGWYLGKLFITSIETAIISIILGSFLLFIALIKKS